MSQQELESCPVYDPSTLIKKYITKVALEHKNWRFQMFGRFYTKESRKWRMQFNQIVSLYSIHAFTTIRRQDFPN